MGDTVSGTTDWVRRAYDCSEVMMATVAGPEHVFVAVNEAYLRFHGHPDVIGRRPQDLWPELEGQQLVRFLDRVRAEAQPAAFEEWCFQFVRDGSLEDVWLDFSLVPAFMEPEAYTQFWLDTERRMAPVLRTIRPN